MRRFGLCLIKRCGHLREGALKQFEQMRIWCNFSSLKRGVHLALKEFCQREWTAKLRGNGCAGRRSQHQLGVAQVDAFLTQAEQQARGPGNPGDTASSKNQSTIVHDRGSLLETITR